MKIDVHGKYMLLESLSEEYPASFVGKVVQLGNSFIEGLLDNDLVPAVGDLVLFNEEPVAHTLPDDAREFWFAQFEDIAAYLIEEDLGMEDEDDDVQGSE